MISLLFAGDFCPMGRISRIIDDGDYETIFKEVKPIISNNDLSIVNFESPILTTNGSEIKKAGPNLKCSPKAVDAIKYAGFNCVTLANNHFYDQGDDGVRDTIDILSKSGIFHVGGGYNLADASKTLYYPIQNKVFALINCCEHEFSIATDTTGGSNPLNAIHQHYAIVEAKQKSDYVIVIVHGGIEHYQYPSPRMVETYRFFIDSGADVVINHHQHCFSGCETYKGKPIFYGLGNFCFDWKERSSVLWDEGFMVRLEFEDRQISYKLFPYNQNGETPGIHLKDSDANDEWKKRFDEISSVISDRERLDERYQSLLNQTERIYSVNITPYTSRLFIALYMRHILPILLPKKKLRTLLNMFLCESHYDRMISMLKNYSK